MSIFKYLLKSIVFFFYVLAHSIAYHTLLYVYRGNIFNLKKKKIVLVACLWPLTEVHIWSEGVGVKYSLNEILL